MTRFILRYGHLYESRKVYMTLCEAEKASEEEKAFFIEELCSQCGGSRSSSVTASHDCECT